MNVLSLQFRAPQMKKQFKYPLIGVVIVFFGWVVETGIPYFSIGMSIFGWILGYIGWIAFLEDKDKGDEDW